MTKEQVQERFRRAQQRKRECLNRLEQSMKATYEERTGKPANYFFAL